MPGTWKRLLILLNEYRREAKGRSGGGPSSSQADPQVSGPRQSPLPPAWDPHCFSLLWAGKAPSSGATVAEAPGEAMTDRDSHPCRYLSLTLVLLGEPPLDSQWPELCQLDGWSEGYQEPFLLVLNSLFFPDQESLRVEEGGGSPLG